MDVVIKTKFNNIVKFVTVSDDESINYIAYTEKALETFGISTQDLEGVFMWDRDGAEITVDNFASVIRQFRHSNSFLIRLSISSKPDSTLLTQELKMYLMENGLRTLFTEDKRNQETNVKMNSKSVNELAKKLCTFVDVKFETLANSGHISNVCNSAIQLFCSIGEVEVLYDAKNKSGLVYHKISYKRYHKKELVKSLESLQLESEDSLTDAEEMAAFLFFRTCIVFKEKEILKIKLKQTIRAREATIKKKGTVFFQSFPFYFVDPDLITFDYEIRSPDINHNALIETWPQLKIDIFCILNIAEREQCDSFYDAEIGYFIALMKLISQKPKFEERVAQLVIFSDANNEKPEYLVNQPSHPCLVAYGTDRKNIRNYCIGLENHFIPLPESFTFLHVFDCFFKMHKVFHINYHPMIKGLMSFIDYYIFGDKVNSSTNRKMADLAIKLKL